jgi:hypothetical protein
MTRAARVLLLSGIVAVSAACGSPPPAPRSSVQGAPTAPTPTGSAAASATAPATSQLTIAIADLPLVEPDPETLTAICDPEPNQIDPDAGETSVFCFDGVRLGLRATRTAILGPIRRAYLMRAACAPSPCPSDALDTATVALWTDGGVVTVRIDSRLDTVGVPQPLLVDPWPAVAGVTSPAVKRESLVGAPAVVASRTPYPSCGHAANDAAAAVLSCFRSLVLLGRPAEMVQSAVATEGGQIIDLFRFSGMGAITRDEQAEGRWIEQRGSMILGARDGTWSFEPWDEGVVLR